MADNVSFIDELSKISTPIVYDAIEKFNVRPCTEGYTDSTIKCIYPDMKPVCGYACTGKITGVLPGAEGEKGVPSKEVWKYVRQNSPPGIMVLQDLDEEPRRACAWGDFSVSIFKALDCRGALTNGYVRDVDSVKSMGFQLFAKSKIAGHGYIRYVEINTPVKVAGLVIKPGEILHGDMHGVIKVPGEIPIVEIIEMARKCLDSEGKVISYCKSSGFTMEGLFREIDLHEKRAGGHFK